MTIDRRDLKIPAWVLSIIIPLVIAIVGYAIGISTVSARSEIRLDHLHEEVIELNEKKASDERVNGVETLLESVQGTVIRIETKLDEHITDSPKH